MKGHRWFNVHSLSLDPNEIKALLENKMRQPYVEKFIQKPFIDHEKITILNEIYDHVELPIQEKKQLIITIMLVQIALDTHELIPSDGSSVMTETEKQLSVLAGDYYSGLYYLLLAEMQNIEMIQLLANAIKQINEQKMTLYYEDINTFNELIHAMTQVESLLFTNVAYSFNMENTFIELIEEVLLVNRLYKEIESIQQQRHSYSLYFFKNNGITDDKYNVILRIEEKIAQHIEEVERLTSQLPYSFRLLKSNLREQFDLAYNTTLAEEG